MGHTTLRHCGPAPQIPIGTRVTRESGEGTETDWAGQGEAGNAALPASAPGDALTVGSQRSEAEVRLWTTQEL